MNVGTTLNLKTGSPLRSRDDKRRSEKARVKAIRKTLKDLTTALERFNRSVSTAHGKLTARFPGADHLTGGKQIGSSKRV